MSLAVAIKKAGTVTTAAKEAMRAAMAKTTKQADQTIVLEESMRDTSPQMIGRVLCVETKTVNGKTTTTVTFKLDDDPTAAYPGTSGTHTVKDRDDKDAAVVDKDAHTLTIIPQKAQKYGESADKAAKLLATDAATAAAGDASRKAWNEKVAADRAAAEAAGETFEEPDAPEFAVARYPNGIDVRHDGKHIVLRGGEMLEWKVRDKTAVPEMGIMDRILVSTSTCHYLMVDEAKCKIFEGYSTAIDGIRVIGQSNPVTFVRSFCDPDIVRGSIIPTPARIFETDKYIAGDKWQKGADTIIVPRIESADDRISVFGNGQGCVVTPTIGETTAVRRDRTATGKGKPVMWFNAEFNAICYDKLIDGVKTTIKLVVLSFSPTSVLGIKGADLYAYVLPSFLAYANYFMVCRANSHDTFIKPTNRLEHTAAEEIKKAFNYAVKQGYKGSLVDYHEETQPERTWFLKLWLEGLIAVIPEFLEECCLPISMRTIAHMASVGALKSTSTTMQDPADKSAFTPVVTDVKSSSDGGVTTHRLLNEMSKEEIEKLLESDAAKAGEYRFYAVPPAGSLQESVKEGLADLRTYWRNHNYSTDLILADTMIVDKTDLQPTAVINYGKNFLGLSEDDAIRAAGLDPANAFRADKPGRLSSDALDGDVHPFIHQPQPPLFAGYPLVAVYYVHVPSYEQQIADADAELGTGVEEDAEPLSGNVRKADDEGDDDADVDDKAEQPAKRPRIREIVDEEETSSMQEGDALDFGSLEMD